MNPDYDLCIIGGGINGVGIARDAAGRGLKVLLLEKGDLASATSSASTKLIHGGLRYLEYYEFKLVRASLKEREILLSAAPHLIRPMNFVLPHDRTQRPYWMIGAGLFLYDHLARRDILPASQRLNFKSGVEGKPLALHLKKGYRYTDCWVDDSRFVVGNAMDARERGAEILVRTSCTGLHARKDRWEVGFRDERTGEEKSATAAMAINATGPWVKNILERLGLDSPGVPRIRLVKGSHIITRRLFQGSYAYILQQPDKRIVFAIPYENDYTLIGTTEENYDGDIEDVRISDSEIEYLCASFNRSFKEQISLKDVLWTYSGVRPLLDDGSDAATEVTRDYHLHLHKNEKGGPPLLSIFGGKLTTYRVLAEEAICKLLGDGYPHKTWTGAASLPGGDISLTGFRAFLQQKAKDYPWLPRKLVMRYAHSYGTRMDRFLEGAHSLSDLGRDFGGGLHEAEILYLIRHEWARTAEDILWRRSKLGLHVSDEISENLEAAMPAMLEKGEAA